MSADLTVNDLQDRVHAWANETFPARTPAIAWMKLFEELGEVIKNPEDPLEWADVFIILLDLASMHEVNIPDACIDKMAINRGRVWAAGISGVMQHVEGGLDLSSARIDPKTKPPLAPSTVHAVKFIGGHKDGCKVTMARMVDECQTAWWPWGANGGCYYLEHSEPDDIGYIVYIYTWSEDGIPF